MSYLMTADLHLKPETAKTVFEVLERFTLTADEVGADYLVLLGDIYDVRYHVPIELQNQLLDWVLAQERELIILPGNHDQDNAAGRHALEVFGLEPGVHVMTEPGWNEHGLWLPYRKDPLELSAFVQNNPRPDDALNIAWLHHGIVGALMNDHVVAGDLDGIRPGTFDELDVVFCGHWHRHQEIQNCVYVGSPWQTRADEAGQEKGFIHLGEDGWEFVPVRVGRRHHRVHVGAGGPIASGDLQPGDVVHVVLESAEDAPRVVSELSSVEGLDVRLAPPKQEYGDARLGLGSAASAEEYARAYAQDPERTEGLMQHRLLELFKEIAS